MTMNNQSHAEKFAQLPKEKREEVLSTFTAKQLKDLKYDWDFWGRPKQKLPKDDIWDQLWVVAGRGFGKTRMAAEAIKEKVYEGVKIIALVGRTPADVRDVLIFGESGLMNVFKPEHVPIYKKSERKVIFHTGAIAHVYSGENPGQLRGPQHEFAVLDEFAAYQYPEEVLSNLMFGLRLGKNPQLVVTTTPKPIPELIKARDDSKQNDRIKIITGSTYENKNNLPESFLNAIKRKYEGTKTGRQEIYAEILDNIGGSLWSYSLINRTSISDTKYDELTEKGKTIIRTVVAIDPAVSTNENSDTTGIVVVSTDSEGVSYVREDSTGKYSPDEWANMAYALYNKYNADCVVAESNQGGDLVKSNILSVSREIDVKLVRAVKSKMLRAEPVSSLSQQDRLFFVGDKLEDIKLEMINWTPLVVGTKSPNRLDALVWAMHELVLNDEAIFDKVDVW